MFNQQISERFRRLGRKETRVRISHRIQLRLNRINDYSVTMAKTRHSRTARGIEILLAAGIIDVTTFATHRDGWQLLSVSWENMRHLRSFYAVPGIMTCLAPS